MDRILSLEGELTVVAAVAVRERIAGLLQSSTEPATLDLAAVEAVDSAGIQLLLSARRSAASRGTALRFSGAPAVVVDALRVFGVDAAALDTGTAS